MKGRRFLTARRAYCFLNEQQLSAGQQEKLEAFRLKHIDSL